MQKFCVLLMVISLFSCKKDNRIISEIKELTGKTITFVKGYESLCINDSLSISSIISEDIKIISFIEDFPCTSCTMEMLSDWIKVVKSFEEKVGFLLVINTPKKDELFKALQEHDISHPIMYYDSDIFKEQNKLNVLTRNRTFLLNQNNEIVLVGEPFNNRKLFELYNKTIKDLTNDGK